MKNQNIEYRRKKIEEKPKSEIPSTEFE